MTKLSPDGLIEWNRLIEGLARQYAGLGPLAREAFIRRLIAQDEYQHADPSLEAASMARRELLLALADRLSRPDRVTDSTSALWNRQGEFDVPTKSQIRLRRA